MIVAAPARILYATVAWPGRRKAADALDPDQVNWGVFDFIFAALLIGSLGLGWEIILRTTCHRLWRAVLVLAVLATVLLIWAELAVGIIN